MGQAIETKWDKKVKTEKIRALKLWTWKMLSAVLNIGPGWGVTLFPLRNALSPAQ